MEGKVKCKKCGRVLKSPLSIAMGMGPKCAGVSSAQGCRIHIGIRRSSGKSYQAVGVGSNQVLLIPSERPERKFSKRELARRRREERRHLFEQHQPFQCGILTRGKTPLIYEPTGEKEWKDKVSGRVVSHEHLQDYLKRYRFI